MTFEQMTPQQTMFKLYSVFEAGYLAMTAETKFDLLVNNHRNTITTVQVCYDKLQRERPPGELGEEKLSDTPQLIKHLAFSFTSRLR